MVSLPPPRTTELFYDGDWNPVAVRESSGLTIKRGVSAEGSRAEPATANLTLDNREGALSPRNPNSPLYGKIGRNTPIRIAVDAGTPWLTSPGTTGAQISTPDSAALTVAGDLDLRMEVALPDWRRGHMLALRYFTTGNSRSWAFEIDDDGLLRFLWSPDGTFASRLDEVSTVPVPAHQGQRLALRVNLDINNGAAGHTVRFYYAQSLTDDIWLPLGEAIVGTGTTSVFDGTAPLEVGDGDEFSSLPSGGALGALEGNVHGLQLRDDSTLKVDLNFSTAQVGDTTVTDATGLLWTLSGGTSLTNRHVRMAGEVPAWPPERDLSGNDRKVTIAPAGIMRRLGAGTKPLDSALLRFIQANNPIECWPLTDGKLSSLGASLVGGSPMLPRIDFGTGSMQWTAGTLAEWIEPVARFPAETDGVLHGQVPDSVAAATGWSVDMFVSGMGTEQDLLITDRGAGVVGDTRQSWYLTMVPADNEVTLTGSSGDDTGSSATLLTAISSADIFDDQPHHIRLTVTPGGSNTAWAVYLDGVSRASGTYAPIGKAARMIQPGWWASLVTDGTASNGYVTYWGPTAPTAADIYQALHGFPGETAGERILRVAEEQGVPMSVSGMLDEQTRLGTQHPQRFLDVLHTAAQSDVGYVLEQRDDRALIYRGRATLYNQTPVLTLDFPTGVIAAPFKPLDDDKLTQNDVTVQRDGGSKGIAVLEEGRMSVLDPPDGVGRYDVAHTLSLEEDAQAEQLAGWHLNLGTSDGLRYTKLTLKLGNPRVYALVDQIMRLDVGDKIRIINLPADYGPDDVDLIVRGYEERIGEDWQITFNCTPGEPYAVLQPDSGESSRVDTADCELASAIGSDDTTLQVFTTDGPMWVDSSTHPDDFPISLNVEGEEVTATAITSAVIDAFGRTVASGSWGTSDVGGSWTTAGGSTSDYSVGAGYGSMLLSTLNVSRRTFLAAPGSDVDLYVDVATNALATGASLYGGPVARHADGNNLYMARFEFTTAAAVILSIRKRAAGVETQLATYTTDLTHVAGTFYRMRFQVAGSALRAKAWPVAAVEPELWQATAADSDLTAAQTIGCRAIGATGNTTVSPTVRFDNFACVNPQAITVTRSINGITKAHASGAAVQLARPVVIPL